MGREQLPTLWQEVWKSLTLLSSLFCKTTCHFAEGRGNKWKTLCLLLIPACAQGPPGRKEAHLLTAGIPPSQPYLTKRHVYHSLILPLPPATIKSFHILALVPKQPISVPLSGLPTIQLGARTVGGGNTTGIPPSLVQLNLQVSGKYSWKSKGT